MARAWMVDWTGLVKNDMNLNTDPFYFPSICVFDLSWQKIETIQLLTMIDSLDNAMFSAHIYISISNSTVKYFNVYIDNIYT